MHERRERETGSRGPAPDAPLHISLTSIPPADRPSARRCLGHGGSGRDARRPEGRDGFRPGARGRRRSRELLPGAALLLCAALLFACGAAVAQDAGSAGEKPAPSDAAPSGPRSRLTIQGLYETDTYYERNFLLGAASNGALGTQEREAFWTQRLNLRPRFILSDHLNVNLSVDVASGIWGIEHEGSGGAAGDATDSGAFARRKNFHDLRLQRAYLAFRHPGSRTRWYLGRQEFGLGNLLVLDVDAPGLQVYRDFGRSASLGIGAAKESESFGITDARYGSDALGYDDERDADLLFAEGRIGDEERGIFLNPFVIWYADRSNADGATWLPDGQEPDARFRPHVSSATVFALALRWSAGALRLDGEADLLQGNDRVRNTDSGPREAHDVNNGDIEGMNGFARLAYAGSRVEIALTGARGSGDPDPFRDEGNVNALRTDGRWYLTEVWENGLALAERGLAPTGLGNPYVRGYRGLENTTALQAAASVYLRANLRLGGSFTLLRSTEALKGWSDADVPDGRISAGEYGDDPFGPRAESTELGSEIDWWADWRVDPRVTLSLRGGLFSPGPAAGYLINGTQKFTESPFLLRFGVAVPIPEFSLGG